MPRLMSDDYPKNEMEAFEGFSSIEQLKQKEREIFAFVMALSSDGAGVNDLTDAQKIERIELRLLDDNS